MVRISDENGLDKNREIWALSDQGSWCTFRGPFFALLSLNVRMLFDSLLAFLLLKNSTLNFDPKNFFF